MGARADVVIITAAEGEDTALRDVHDGRVGAWSRIKSPAHYPYDVYLAEFARASGERLRVVTSRPGRMRGDHSAQAAGQLITAFEPRCVAMCGVCAGRPGWTELGDVIIGDRVQRFDTGERFNAVPGAIPKLRRDTEQFQLSPTWLRAAEDARAWASGWPGERTWLDARPRPLELQALWLLQQLDAGRDPEDVERAAELCGDRGDAFDLLEANAWVDRDYAITEDGRTHLRRELMRSRRRLPEQGPWALHVGPMATSNQLVRDVDIWEQLEDEQRLIRGFDMEVATIGQVGWSAEIPFLVVKGVMDFALPERHRGFRPFAARAAAEVLMRLLRTLELPAQPTSVSVQVKAAVTAVEPLSTRDDPQDTLRATLTDALQRCDPALLVDVLTSLGHELDAHTSIPPSAAQADALVRSMDHAGGLEALRHALFAAAPDTLPVDERELAGLRARVRAYLGRAYPRASNRAGVAGELGLDIALARGSLDGLLLQLPGRAAMRSLVRLAVHELADPEREREDHDELTALLHDLRDGVDDERRALRAWLEWTRDSHRALLEFHPWTRARALDDVFVEVRVAGHAAATDACLDGRHALPRAREFTGAVGKRSLEAVLNEPELGQFWTLVGHPGTGKTTLLRRVTIDLATAALEAATTGASPARVPVYVALAAWERADEPLLAHVIHGAARTRHGIDEDVREQLRGALDDGRALLLLDGLDEVDDADAVARMVAEVAREWPKCQVVMSSRPEGYRRPSNRFGELELVPLDAGQQRALAVKWLEGDERKADALCAKIQRDVSLRALAEVPLLMTMMCLVERARLRKTLPKDRAAPRAPRPRLYHEVTRLLLAGKPVAGPKSRRIKNEGVARRALEELALALLKRGGLEWERDDIDALLFDDPAQWDRVQRGFGGTTQFLQEVAGISGLLFATDALHSRYRFLHRSLQEYLAACALKRRGQTTWGALAAEVSDERGRWSETFSLLAGMLPRDEAVTLLRELTERNEALGQRALATCDGLEDSDVVELLRLGRLEADWTGWPEEKRRAVQERRRFYADLVERINDPPRAVQLLARLLPGASVLDLALVYRVLEGVDAPEARALLQRERFFELAGRPLVDVGARWEPARELTFKMGSPESEEGRYDNEGPQHEVTLAPYEVMTTPVTWGMYREFARDHGPRRKHESDEHPVTNVSWYEARLFAAWLGGQLPTEAQWECACRAGNQARFCFGDDEARLRKYAWFSENAGDSTHPVGEKKPNAWGLYDMHGNVWEWCDDDQRKYESQAEQEPAGPTNEDVRRVVRGGFAWYEPGLVRSAFRDGHRVVNRNGVIGFRCVRRPRRQH